MAREEQEHRERDRGPQRVQDVLLVRVLGDVEDPEHAEDGPSRRADEVGPPVLPEEPDAEQGDPRGEEDVVCDAQGGGHGPAPALDAGASISL